LDKNFWIDAWKEGKTRFHRDKPNDDLVHYLPRFKKHKSVFVPLCGKSLDMLYLRTLGLDVVGVELSDQAIQEFQTENKLQMNTIPHGDFIIYEIPGLQIYHGDLFDLRRMELDGVSFCYDRASLVALPLSLRIKYYTLLKGFQDIKEILLISFEYDQALAAGPPFSVPQAEIQQYLSDEFIIEVIDRREVEDLNPKFQDAGIKEFWRVVYRLGRK
jgi:thiopurine S-methyltransferase